MNYIISNTNVAVVDDAGKFYNVPASDSRFSSLRTALEDKDFDSAIAICRGRTPTASFSGEDGVEAKALPRPLLDKIDAFAREGKSVRPVHKFWAKVQKNPNPDSVVQLWKFMEHKGLPLAKDGDFYAYKSVRQDYLDHHTGTVDYTPGHEVSIDRDLVDPDPDTDCGRGLHVGSLEYARDFGTNGRLIVVKCDPADVVSVPNDYDCQKMRLCRVFVVGDYVAQNHMPETVLEEDDDVNDFEVEAEELEPVQVTEAEAVKSKSRKLKQVPVWLMTETKAELLNRSLDELRKAASKHLHLVGASKIPGGKPKLVLALIKARKKV